MQAKRQESSSVYLAESAGPSTEPSISQGTFGEPLTLGQHIRRLEKAIVATNKRLDGIDDAVGRLINIQKTLRRFDRFLGASREAVDDFPPENEPVFDQMIQSGLEAAWYNSGVHLADQVDRITASIRNTVGPAPSNPPAANAHGSDVEMEHPAEENIAPGPSTTRSRNIIPFLSPPPLAGPSTSTAAPTTSRPRSLPAPAIDQRPTAAVQRGRSLEPTQTEGSRRRSERSRSASTSSSNTRIGESASAARAR